MMRLFFAVLALLMLALIVHIVTWRVHLPKRSIRALLCIFAATPLVVVAIYFAIESWPVFTGASLADAVRILLFYVSCSLVYVVLYSAIEAKSPSLAIVSYVASCGGAGCAGADLANHITDDDSISTRIAAMKASGMIVVKDGLCSLTTAGHLWAALFEFASNIFRLPLGG
jgi:hypothetical protein